HVSLEDCRMDVTLAANGRGISQSLCDAFNGPWDVSLGRGLGVEVLEYLKRSGGQCGPGPSAEVLGGNFHAADHSQILVDVARIDIADASVLVHVLKQLLARELLALANNSRQALVFQVDFVLDPTFAAKFETDFFA